MNFAVSQVPLSVSCPSVAVMHPGAPFQSGFDESQLRDQIGSTLAAAAAAKKKKQKVVLRFNCTNMSRMCVLASGRWQGVNVEDPSNK